ncbi:MULTISPECIES: hypothetical protein [Halomicrobium]|uniref:Uncharacterized protein n=1 Tax=Halomicrobium mukohataei (strain ATCC 700874 / DSM 12286 / JCM 9738 / NCIMB 13541) TaxID=485914 RepID=C7P420_HALMD|nr:MULTISPECIES: hypothetical protein [Halomicrobium]ACV47842.1 hypothetical protein Hmuk_1728 [Halomicrobium mukohataei DSM 12286]
MTTRIEYGTKDAADAARDRHEEYLCTDDDRRLKTVAYSDADTPDHVLDAERLEAEDSRGEGSDGPGQVPLSDGERDRIDFGKARASVPHAKAVKGIARSEGVEDWVSYYDGTLTVDEHREVMADASRESGKRTDEQESADEKAADAAQTAKGERCDHARGHCEAGDPEACEFLTETCQYDFDDVQEMLLAQRAPDDRPAPSKPEEVEQGEAVKSEELTGKQKGALKQAWNGYLGALDAVDDALETLANEWVHAQQAARTINEIRETVGQQPLHFEKLEGSQADLMDLARQMAADCYECHADHSDHSHPVTQGDREHIRQVVAGTDSDEQGEAPVEGADSSTEAENEQVLQGAESAQVDLSGEREQQNQQTALAVEADTRTAQGRESTAEAPVNRGGLLADERDDPSMGAENGTESTDQQQFHDPEQGTISEL